MRSFHLFVAAGSLSGFVAAAPTLGSKILSTPLNNINKRAPADAYTVLKGDGGSEAWPKQKQWWSSLDEMFSYNLPLIERGCDAFSVANPSAGEIQDVYKAIEKVSAETGVDGRFILAIALQESNACVRAPTTYHGIRNPGIMQDHNGVGTCNEAGKVSNPCPATTIYQMIKDGTAGTASGDGLQQGIKTAESRNAHGANKFYVAARIYNSGSIHSSGLLEEGGSTRCYSSDIANRLAGWRSAQKTCSFDGTPGPAFDYDGPEPDFVPKAGLQAPPQGQADIVAPVMAELPASLPPKAAPVTPDIAVKIATPPVPETPVTRNRAVSANMAPGVTTECAKYYTVDTGDFCDSVAQKFSTTFVKLRALNQELDAVCGNLWLGYDYCVEAL